MASLRLFVALHIPPGVRAQLATQLRVIERDLPPRALSAVAAQNFHLTLCFLGEVDSEQIEALGAALDAVCQHFKSTAPNLTLHCRGLGIFPNLRQPRVLWAGVTAPGDGLKRLQFSVAQACVPFLSEPQELSFSPHVTLGRMRHLNAAGRNALIRHLDTQEKLESGSWTATEIALMQSEIGNGPVRYTTLRRFSIIN